MTCHIIDFRQASTSPLNPLSARLRQYIATQLATAIANPAVTSIILTGGPLHFSAGADLTEFAQFQQQRHHHGNSAAGGGAAGASGGGGDDSLTLIDVVQQIEDCPKPVVAAISGTCLGGGLEVALAAHYRIATSSSTSSTKLGLPEVHVGVIPGAGGTQRLPRLVGMATAARLILTGATVSAPQALQLKLIDDVVTNVAQLIPKAQAWASWAEVMPPRRLGQQSVPEHVAAVHTILHVASLSLPRNEGSAGQEAALQALRASVLPLHQGMAVEAECFMQTLASPAGMARRHNFFAVRQAQKPYTSSTSRYSATGGKLTTSHLLLDKTKVTPTAVIGAGTMGSGIALVLLQAGFAVTLVDIKPEFLQSGVAKIAKIVQTQVTRQRIQASTAKAMLERLQTTTDLHTLGHCQLVVEAVVENLPLKQNIFATLDQVLPDSALVLSNTSTLSIDAMASALQPARRGQFAGWHFFSPAHVMKLVEIVLGQDTLPSTVLLVQALTKRIGKTGVVVGNCDGFCGNRLLKPYSSEMVMVVVEGLATIAAVDQALRGTFGMAMGPFEMADLSGNDVGYNIRKERGWVRESPHDPIPPNRPARYTELGDIMISKYGRLGQKTGKGWYDYDPTIGKGRTPLPSKEVNAIVEEYTLHRGQGHISAEQIIERLLYPLVNEGFKCLEEGIVQRPGDIDVVYVYGYGWPVWRGGPMHWADHQVGLPKLLQSLQRMAQQFPQTEHYQPSALLVKCVQMGVTVEEYYRNQTKSKL